MRVIKTQRIVGLLVLLIIVNMKSVYANNLSQYYYYEKVLEPSSILSYIHNDDGHEYRTESGGKPTYEEAQDWWISILKKRPEIKILLTEKQKHTGMSYESICMIMCNNCGLTVNTKDTYELIDEEENEAYKSAIQTLVLNNYRVLDSNGESIRLDIDKWYSDYDKGLYDKRDNMTHHVHDKDRSHAYRTKSGIKPEYEEAMEWWKDYIESIPDITQNFTEQQIAGKGMYEYITELMCIDCRPTKAEEGMNEAVIIYDKQKAEIAGIGEIYPEKNGKQVAKLREQAKKLGYTIHLEDSKWIDQEILAEQMKTTVIIATIMGISLSLSILIMVYIIRKRR